MAAKLLGVDGLKPIGFRQKWRNLSTPVKPAIRQQNPLALVSNTLSDAKKIAKCSKPLAAKCRTGELTISQAKRKLKDHDRKAERKAAEAIRLDISAVHAVKLLPA